MLILKRKNRPFANWFSEGEEEKSMDLRAERRFLCSPDRQQLLCGWWQQATTEECTRIATNARENLSRNSPT
jgi:hypothetical protein